MKNEDETVEILETWEKRGNLVYKKIKYRDGDEWVDMPTPHDDVPFVWFEYKDI